MIYFILYSQTLDFSGSPARAIPNYNLRGHFTMNFDQTLPLLFYPYPLWLTYLSTYVDIGNTKPFILKLTI